MEDAELARVGAEGGGEVIGEGGGVVDRAGAGGPPAAVDGRTARTAARLVDETLRLLP